MKLNLAKKNILSDKNIQDIVRIGINFGEKINQITEKCVEEYKEDALYSPKMLCIYDSYIWECKYSTQGTWDNTKWTKLADEFSLIELDELKTMLNLTDEELKTLQSLILDSSIELSHVWSSSKTYEEIQQCLSDSKTYTLKELSKKMGASYKVVTATNEVTSTEFLYLISNGTAYDIYALIDGVATKLGDTTIDLSNYYTKNEIDNDFLKKTDADGKYTAQTSFNNHTSDTDIHTSATEKASYVKKTDITTTIDSTSTDSQVPSAKVVNSLLNNKTDKMVILMSQNTNDLVNEGSYYVVEATNAPDAYGWIDVLANTNYTIQLFYPSLTANCEMYIRRRQNGGAWTPWQKLCTTSVADVGVTNITDTLMSSNASGGALSYFVKDGICYIGIDNIRILSASSGGSLSSFTFPIPYLNKKTGYKTIQSWGDNKTLLVVITGNGGLAYWCPTDSVGSVFNGSFSYPVSES